MNKFTLNPASHSVQAKEKKTYLFQHLSLNIIHEAERFYEFYTKMKKNIDIKHR